MKHTFIVFALYLLAGGLGCVRESKQTCELFVKNDTTREFAEVWVNCGMGRRKVGVLIPGAEAGYMEMPMRSGATVTVEWRIEGETDLLTKSNLVRAGLQPGHSLVITFGEDGIAAKVR